MNVWIITTGSSDVQLNTSHHWQNLLRNVRNQLDNRGFTLTEGTDNRFLAHARVMGTVYSQPPAKEYWGDLVFPLLDNFVGQIHNEVIDEIILILTDQAAVFSPEEKRSQNSAYWQDTCTLEPILKTYLAEKFPQAEIHPLLLQPQSPESLLLQLQSPKEGLDDWDYVLKLVQKKFANFNFPKQSTIYVSHQAGTPAISSAVQFSSLAKFGQQVKFLVSSERNSSLTRILDSSTYLRGIRLQEAKALLNRYDYSGVKELLSYYLTPEIQDLLDAAIQWNFAKFEDFINQLESYPKFAEDVQKRKQPANWWWTAYEAAYLGVVRLEQGNTVEALFHSFRSVEGLIAEWAKSKYSQYVKYEKDKYGKIALFVKKQIQTIVPNYRKKDFHKQERIKLFSQSLYDLLQEDEDKRNCKQHSDMNVFLNDARDERNKLFHQIEGLQESEVFKAWGTKTKEEWKKRILGCLNFIAKEDLPQEDLPQGFTSLEEASLMFQVHKKLEKAIAQYEHIP